MTRPEKRKQQRLGANLFAELLDVASGQARGRAVVVDVSLGGVALESESEFSPGDLVECMIEVPLVFQAKVVRFEMKGQIRRYGLKFVSQSIFDKLLLKKVLKGPRRTRKVSL